MKNLTIAFGTCALVLTWAFNAARADDESVALTGRPQEHITETVKRDKAGNITRSTTTRRMCVSVGQTVTEVRLPVKGVGLQIVERTTDRTDLSGNQFLIKEKRLAGETGLTTVYWRTIIVDPNGGSIQTEKARNKDGVLTVTRRVTVTGSQTDRRTIEERPDKSGNLTVVAHTQVVTRTLENGSRVTVNSRMNAAGDMVPVRRNTCTREINGSSLSTVEVKNKDDEWVVISESTVVQTRVSAGKVFSVEGTNRGNPGPQQ